MKILGDQLGLKKILDNSEKSIEPDVIFLLSIVEYRRTEHATKPK